MNGNRRVVKGLTISFLFCLMLILGACGKTGKDSIAENEGLAKILGTGAAGMSGTRGDEEVKDLPDVDSVNMRSNPAEGAYYFKLVDGANTVMDAGDYTVGMADNLCTITVYNASGEAVQSVNISAQGAGGKSPIKNAAMITVPEGGSATAVGGSCVAQKRPEQP
ncbi:MAG: hypothetical protein K5668_07900 [Lachnospiraceae bacterium]|nr:hypothetical protein [Lachnospiraceae bacterium]